MAINTNELKEKLVAERKLLIQELSGLGIMNPENNDWEAVPPKLDDANDTSDENDSADRFEDYEERSATLSILEERFKDVSSALKRLEEGTFGICEVGGEAIDEDRLNANPAARTCVKHIPQ